MRPEIENTPIPEWMKKLPRDRRGYPIPYIVTIDNTGTPQFTINEESKRQEVLKKDLCGICGRKLLRWRALVGGPGSAFLKDWAYIDPPMHIECAHYALKVCPYLAVPSWAKEIGTKKLKPGALGEDVLVLVDSTMIPGRPQLFVVAVHTKVDYTYFGDSKVIQYVKPRKPYVRAEYWRQGKQIPDEEAKPEIREELSKLLISDSERVNKDFVESAVQGILQRL